MLNFEKTTKLNVTIVPGFSRYGVTDDGKVWDFKTNELCPLYPNKLGYITVTAWADDAKRSFTTGVHRLMGLALLDINEDVTNMVINHKDGNKANNVKLNLEFCTKGYNNLHAPLTDLRSDNLEILVRDPKTDEVTSFKSHAICARYMGLNPNVIDLRAKSKGQKVFSDGLQYMDFRDADEYVWGTDLTIVNGAPKTITLKHNVTGITKTFNSVGKAAEFLNIKSGTLAKRIRVGNTIDNNWSLHQSSSVDNTDVSFLSNCREES